MFIEDPGQGCRGIQLYWIIGEMEEFDAWVFLSDAECWNLSECSIVTSHFFSVVTVWFRFYLNPGWKYPRGFLEINHVRLKKKKSGLNVGTWYSLFSSFYSFSLQLKE